MTTTCDLLWLGVPVVTLSGDCAHARAGAMLLTAAELPDLVASTQDEFVNLAASLASDRARLGQLRATLRDSVERSPLRREGQLAMELEGAYRSMWVRWCAGSSIPKAEPG
jgi:predicted O-linked N-acetylglucosamine transferase (SPINDLY family)